MQCNVVLRHIRGCVSVSEMMVDKSEDMIFYNRDFMKKYHDAPNNKKNTVPGPD